MALLEAMACGLPVVALSTCAVPEIITHAYNGMISEDPRDLQNYCRELLMDEGMRIELGNNARKTIEERFNLNRFTNQWEKVFRNLI
jgi:glycosyltransferase involved in cell wall biosynthesis